MLPGNIPESKQKQTVGSNSTLGYSSRAASGVHPPNLTWDCLHFPLTNSPNNGALAPMFPIVRDGKPHKSGLSTLTIDVTLRHKVLMDTSHATCRESSGNPRSQIFLASLEVSGARRGTSGKSTLTEMRVTQCVEGRA